MSREKTDRQDLFCLYKCVYGSVRACYCVCLWAPPSLPVSDFGTEMWFQLGRFLKSETYWHFKQTGDIFEANAALFLFYYKAPFPDFH